MRAKTVKGMIVTPLTMEISDVTIRAEKTGKLKGVKDNFATLSLADDKRGIMLQVNYEDIKELIRGF
jgi:hypothetical protein